MIATPDAFVALRSIEARDEVNLLITSLRMPDGMSNGLSLALVARRRRQALKILLLADLELERYASGMGGRSPY